MLNLNIVNKEAEQFVRALRHSLLTGSIDDFREGINISALYIEVTVSLVKDVIKNPFKYAFAMFGGSKIDPYEQLRPAIKAFTAKWLRPGG
jgi:hypothetical protein